MVLPIIGSIIGAGASLLGGLMGESGKRRELAQQKEFAQHGIRWRVEDARAAGIHPALAMGASVPSYTPVGLGSSMAEGLSNAGQDVSRAIASTQTMPERADEFTKTSQALTLQRMGLENELLAVQIGRAIAPQSPPFPMASGGYNMPGQPASGVTKFVGGDLPLGPHTPAQDVSDEYGDLVGEGAGILRFIRDALVASGTSTSGTRNYTGHRTGGGF